jgi:hypothetical protein
VPPAAPDATQIASDAKTALSEGKQVVVDVEADIKKPTVGGVITTIEDLAKLPRGILPLIQETKVGYKTTEFWGAIGAVVVTFLNEVTTKEKVIVGVIASAYAVARGIAKNGVPFLKL